MSQQAVIDAWAAMKPWVESTLCGLVQEHSVPNQQQNVGDIGVCNAYNVPTGEPGAGLWGSDGNATVSLSELKISAFTNVKILPASFQDATTVLLPLSFTQLEVHGSYSYTQPCAYYFAGHTSQQTTAKGNGTITQTVSSGTLSYMATFTDKLTLTGVTVTGAITASVDPDDGGLPSWLAAIAQFFSTFNEGDALRGTLQSVFAGADFSQVMLQLLNQKLGG